MKPLKKGIRAGRTSGALTIVIGCLVMSGILRFGVDGVALAKEAGVLRDGRPSTGRVPPTARATCKVAPDIASLLQALKTRKAQLDQRETRLKNRMQALKVAQEDMNRNKAALIKAEKKLAATLAIANSAAETDIQKLTSVYENMKPRNSAGLFAAMDPGFAAGFLSRMRPESAAKIMSNLPPEKAYAISLEIAGRNAKAPRKAGG